MDWKPRTRIYNATPKDTQEECLCISQGHMDHQLTHSKQPRSNLHLDQNVEHRHFPCSSRLLVPFLFQKVKVQERLREPWDGSMTLCTVHA